jgi:hypothetical protein
MNYYKACVITTQVKEQGASSDTCWVPLSVHSFLFLPNIDHHYNINGTHQIFLHPFLLSPSESLSLWLAIFSYVSAYVYFTVLQTKKRYGYILQIFYLS